MTTKHSTPVGAPTMTTPHTNDRTIEARVNFTRMEDVLQLADHLVTLVAITDAEQAVIAQAGEEWQAALRAIGDRATSTNRADQERRAMGYYLALHAIEQTPDALPKVLDAVQERLFVALLPAVVALMHEQAEAAAD